MNPNSEIIWTSHCPSNVSFYLGRWPFLSRELEKVRKREPEEETGRAVGTDALLLGSQGNTEIELESSPEDVICGRKDGETSCAARCSTCSQGNTTSARRGVPPGRQGEPSSEEQAGGLAVSWFSPRFISKMSLNPAVLFWGYTEVSGMWWSNYQLHWLCFLKNLFWETQIHINQKLIQELEKMELKYVVTELASCIIGNVVCSVGSNDTFK